MAGRRRSAQNTIGVGLKQAGGEFTDQIALFVYVHEKKPASEVAEGEFVVGIDTDTDTDTHGKPVAGSPHAVTVRTPDARLVYYAPIGSRSKTAIASLGVLAGYTGYLVRDDYAGWHQFDSQLAGIQQCAAHLIRHCKSVLELHPSQQNWAGKVITVLREAATAVTAAQADECDHLDPTLLADLRARYDKAVAWGIITNQHRDWAGGNHRIHPRPPARHQSRPSLDFHPKPRRALDK